MTDSVVREKEIQSLLLPMQQKPLLLPMVCLAEVIDYLRPDNLTGEDCWYLGFIDWRGIKVPLVSFERFNQNRFTEFSAFSRIAILNQTTKTSKYNFYGLVIQGIPQPLTLTCGDINSSKDEPSQAELARVTVRNLPATIPNLEKLEQDLAAF